MLTFDSEQQTPCKSSESISHIFFPNNNSKEYFESTSFTVYFFALNNKLLARNLPNLAAHMLTVCAEQPTPEKESSESSRAYKLSTRNFLNVVVFFLRRTTPDKESSEFTCENAQCLFWRLTTNSRQLIFQI